MGVPQTRTERYPNPQLWSTLSSAAPQCHGRAISQCGEGSDWAAGIAPSLLLSAVTDPVLRLLCSVSPCEELPACTSFIPSCGKVNKAYKDENMLPSQPFLLHFPKQLFGL